MRGEKVVCYEFVNICCEARNEHRRLEQEIEKRRIATQEAHQRRYEKDLEGKIDQILEKAREAIIVNPSAEKSDMCFGINGRTLKCIDYPLNELRSLLGFEPVRYEEYDFLMPTEQIATITPFKTSKEHLRWANDLLTRFNGRLSLIGKASYGAVTDELNGWNVQIRLRLHIQSGQKY